ncbi:conserved hypothetical protein [Cellulomonas flavigena DSM 20109]|uniref:Hydrolytic protein n=1 Tax=Cellulomonas flavigena (strain ATCC 482 / DSM 20109 / BCRC 11376 / JCM 18109 / NBRC 3775 / NCIMB 8073 / NRS 134) TaxID=446466 RepID=D5UGP7_CELFN|nr:hypothetical protein [Cellulomonas flavigena]ADG75145.1 conserved hypothetical protein [Cellulomonas flavigena DSM 20109]
MTTTAKLDPAHVELSPGTEAVVPLQIRNTGDVVEGYRIEVLGVPAAWTSVEPSVVEGLYPGAGTTVTVRFAPPRSWSVPAGNLDFGIRVVPFEHVEETVTPEGVVEVLPFLDTTAELLPRTSHGRYGARHQVALDNRGNVPVTVSLTAADDAGALGLRLRPQILTVPPGTAEFADLRVRPLRRLWRGADRTKPFVVTVAAETTSPVLLDGTHVQTATVPRWLPKALLAALALLALLVALWFTVLKPVVESAARSSVADEVAQAQEAAQEAQEAAAAAQQSSAGAGQSAAAAQQQVAEMEELTRDFLPPTEILAPTTRRLVLRTGPSTTLVDGEDFVVPAGSTLRLTDLVLSNPQGDFGRLVLAQTPEGSSDEVVLLDVALENFRDNDFHFQTPIVLPAGTRLTMSVLCRQPGAPLNLVPPPTECDDALVFSGTLATPVPTPAP